METRNLYNYSLVQHRVLLRQKCGKEGAGSCLSAQASELRRMMKRNNEKPAQLFLILKKEEAKSTGSNIGGGTFLAKPVEFGDMITCIEKHLSG